MMSRLLVTGIHPVMIGCRGISQLAAAWLFGVTHVTLYRWESDKAPVRFLIGKLGQRRRKA